MTNKPLSEKVFRDIISQGNGYCKVKDIAKAIKGLKSLIGSYIRFDEEEMFEKEIDKIFGEFEK